MTANHTYNEHSFLKRVDLYMAYDMYVLMLVSITLTLVQGYGVQGHSGSTKVKQIGIELFQQLNKAISIRLATNTIVGLFFV